MQGILDYFNLSWQDIISGAASILLLLLTLFIGIRLVNTLFSKATASLQKKGQDPGYLTYFRYLALALVYFICGVEIIRRIPGLSSLMTSLLASSGILAVIVGVASQEAVGNIVSGLLIIIFKPFKVGDTIRYTDNDITGVVEEIGLRHTIIRTPENKWIIIPNGKVNTGIVENTNYGGDEISFKLAVSVTYESDLDLAMDLMRRAIDEVLARLPSPPSPPPVRVTEFGSSAVTLLSWVPAPDLAASFRLKNDMLLSIKRLFDENGVQFAYPHMVVMPKDGQ